MTQKVSDNIRRHASVNYVSPARKAGHEEFEIVAGEVHRHLGLQNRVPQVCAALRSNKFLTENNLSLIEESGPPSGMSTTVKLKYRLRDYSRGASSGGGASSPPTSGSPSPQGGSIYQKIRDLYGIAGELYRSLGGGERVLTEERERFYGSRAGLEKSELQRR